MTAPVVREVSFDLASPAQRADPHPVLARMREQAPVHRQVLVGGDRTAWYLTRYADVEQALRHPDIGRQLDRLPDELAAPHRRRDFDPLAMLRRNVFHLDPPDHTRLRRLISPAFRPGRMAVLDHSIGQVVAGLIDAMRGRGGEADVIAALALPLPVMVTAGLIGFPAGDVVRLRHWSDEISRSGNPARVRRAGLEFVAYLEAHIGQRRARPAADLLTHLVQAGEEGALNQAELRSTVFQLLLAGDETTVNLIGNAVLELLRHPAQLDRLRERPDLIDSAIEEAARFNGPVGHTGTLYALADVPFGETIVPRGDIIVPVLLAANRDPVVFDRPDMFDIGRRPNPHLGFGHGLHFCLGAALARMQARAAVGALVRGFPRLALAVDPARLEWTPDLFLHGVLRLPVLVEG